jgi:tRNA dimethylallyltransferase
MQKVLVIVGPTASGKSALAVRLARERGGEVISADSRQVYRGLDIGTGKITKRQMQGVRHHLLNVASPKKVFTAHDFVRLGRKAISDISARGKLPIVCGGTGFYIDTLLGRVSLAETPRDERLRKQLTAQTAPELFAMLKKKDPTRALMMDTPSERNNKARLIRALEVATHSPKRTRSFCAYDYDVEWIGIDWADGALKQRIHSRLLARMRAGMVAEVIRLHHRGLSWKRMEELGLEYRYISRYLRGMLTKKELHTVLAYEIWQYAKRQRTYWRRNKDICWQK